jgi:hypothetical protein
VVRKEARRLGLTDKQWRRRFPSETTLKKRRATVASSLVARFHTVGSVPERKLIRDGIREEAYRLDLRGPFDNALAASWKDRAQKADSQHSASLDHRNERSPSEDGDPTDRLC